jgi:hypothetical protein
MPDGAASFPVVAPDTASGAFPGPSGSGISYQFEPLIRLIGQDNLIQITQQHWSAIALDRDNVPLVVDWELYLSQERAGTWRAFTARRDGRLIGYIAFNFHFPTRYRTTLYVQEDTIWVVPDVGPLSRALIWRGLWREALKALPRPAKVQGKVRLGATDAALLRGTIGKRFGADRAVFMAVGHVLRKLGLQPVEVVFSTFLK